MNSPALIIPRRLVQDLFHQAQQKPQLEICGLIGATGSEPRSCYPVPNVSREPDHLFDMDEKGQVEAMRLMRERGEDLFAVYHSHPSAPPEPSKNDLEQISYPNAYYFIISLNIKGVLEMRAWKVVEKDLREVPLKIIRE